ncbi:single-stranded-DNA-specific exonuclease RecJ [Metabacillus sp. YM-086]|uniref:single-stranded-DNA-specific exonuclease RecJ n=1 Tax=Metabacillus sp. YM-086 TaxID=3341729 RepID=UPI003A8B6482
MNESLESLKDKAKIEYFAKEFSLEPLVMKLIFERGYRDYNSIDQFLKPDYSNLFEPYCLVDMKKAVDRILFAIKRKEKIAIFGDYDVDGVTATSILYKALRMFKADVTFYIPKRTEGYGLSIDGVDKFADEDVALIITVDNGTTAHDAIGRAGKRGIDVIVTDHHDVLGKYPDCYAFINPKRSDNNLRFPYLSGVGVALKLVQALLLERGYWNKCKMEFFELAALGTIGDAVPLKDENRLIVQLGIEKMVNDPSKGVRALLNLLQMRHITSTSIAYSIVPIINSIGRLSDPNFAVKVLTSNACEEKIEECWRKLIRLNDLRKNLLHEQLLQAELLINLNEINKQKVIVVAGNFHEGITGLLATKISEKYRKPSIVIASSGKGAGRSFSGSAFSFIQAISKCSDFIKSYNGHQAAVELNIHLDRYHQFRQTLQNNTQNIVDEVGFKYEKTLPILEFPKELHDQLRYLEPFGKGNLPPIFYCSEMVERVIYFGNKNQHAKFQIGDKEAILFFRGNEVKSFKNQKLNLECFYSPQSLNNRQFLIHDFKL